MNNEKPQTCWQQGDMVKLVETNVHVWLSYLCRVFKDILLINISIGERV